MLTFGSAKDVSAERSGPEIDPDRDGYQDPDPAADFTPSVPPTTLRQRRADALVAMAESYLRHGPAGLSGGERQQIVVHVDAATLAGREPGRCELEDGPALAAETVRRLACDASRVTVIEDERGQPLDIGRRTRTIPPAIGRALRARDRGCRFPGCCNTRFVDGHHIRHWADGGATRLSNLVLLCRFHHRQVHEGNIQVQRLDDGGLVFRTAEGRSIDGAGRTEGNLDALLEAHARHGPGISSGTAVSRWAGEPLDLGLAVAGLMDRWERGRRECNWAERRGRGAPDA